MNLETLISITESIPMGILYLDVHHRVVYVNKFMKEVVSRSSGKEIEIGSLFYPHFVPNEKADVYLQIFNEVRDGGPSTSVNSVFKETFFPGAECEMLPVCEGDAIAGVNVIAKAIERGETGDRQMPVDNNQTSTEQTNFGFFEFEPKPDGGMSIRHIGEGFCEIYEDPNIAHTLKGLNSVGYNVHSADSSDFSSSLSDSIQSGSKWVHEFRVKVNERTKWLRGFAEQDSARFGRPVWTGFVEDISEEKEVHFELLELGAKFKGITQKLDIGLFEFEVSKTGAMKLLYASSTFTKIYFGKEVSVLIEDVNTIFDMIHPDDIPSLFASIEKSSQTLEDVNVEYRIIQNDQIKFINSISVPKRTHDGATVWYGVVEDVTKVRRDEVELRRLGTKLKRLTQRIEIGIYEFTISTSGKMTMNFVNEAYERIFFGVTVEEILEDVGVLFKLVHPDDVSLINSTLQESMQHVTGWDIEYRIKKGEEIKWIRGIATPERNLDGSTTWYGYVKDVTVAKREYLRLKLLESVITHTNDMVMITEAEPMDLEDGGPKILYANNAFTKITGYLPEEVIEKTPRILQGPKSNREELDKLKESMKRWQSHTIEIVNYRKNGEEFWNNFTLVPVADDTGWFTHWISIERDVTPYKKQQEELEERNKLLEKIAFHHSHVLRAPVARLMGLVTLILDYPDENNIAMLKHINECAEEIDEIIKNMAKA